MNDPRIDELKNVVMDEDKPVGERREALKLIAQLRNESDTATAAIPAEQLRWVCAGMLNWTQMLDKGLSLRASAEATAAGFAQRERRIKYGR